MRFNEIKPLEEVNMSPTALQTAASQIQALAGLEFELCVPGADTKENLDQDSGMEPDYGQDRSAYSIDNIIDFFTGSEYGLSDSRARQLRNKLEDNFYEFLDSKKSEAWKEQGEEYFYRYMHNNYLWKNEKDKYIEQYLVDKGYDEEEAKELIKNNKKDPRDKDYKLGLDIALEKYNDELAEIWAKQEDKKIAYAEEDFQDNYSWSDVGETDWLRNVSMSDIADQYDLVWPYYISDSTENEELAGQLERIASDFSKAVNRKIEYSTGYHKGVRRPDRYTLEPDGSIDCGEEGYGGLEFISPPLPLNDMLSDLDKVVNWAVGYGCYTNDTTGLHMNISIPGYSLQKVDFVKLVLFLGDEYVLQRFGRLYNTYTRSALQNIKARARNLSTRVDQETMQSQLIDVLNKMRTNLNSETSKLIHGTMTDKYTSVNIKDNYVEFRSPGGDWLIEDLDKLKNTLLRFVVVLDIACDENKYKQEYAKKLYSLISQASMSPKELDVINLFNQYSTGQLNKETLVKTIKDYRKQMDQFQQMVSAADDPNNQTQNNNITNVAV